MSDGAKSEGEVVRGTGGKGRLWRKRTRRTSIRRFHGIGAPGLLPRSLTRFHLQEGQRQSTSPLKYYAPRVVRLDQALVLQSSGQRAAWRSEDKVTNLVKEVLDKVRVHRFVSGLDEGERASEVRVGVRKDGGVVVARRDLRDG